MPYDIVDAHEDIRELAATIEGLVKVLQEKGVLEVPKDVDEQKTKGAK